MVKTFLFCALFLSISSAFLAQCTPGVNFADSTFGAWPDTTTNFPDASNGLTYSTDLNFKVPSDAGDIDSTYAGLQIQNFTVDSVVGLPPGMTYSCNLSNCTYDGGANGCAQIAGTCSVTGTYDITIYITAYLLIFTAPVPYPYSFEGYHINVNELGIAENTSSTASVFPNPVKENLSISNFPFKIDKIEVLNAEGKILMSEDFNNKTVSELALKSLENGVYFVKIYSPEKQELIRFVKAN